jgi:hypothetical protein
MFVTSKVKDIINDLAVSLGLFFFNFLIYIFFMTGYFLVLILPIVWMHGESLEENKKHDIAQLHHCKVYQEP